MATDVFDLYGRVRLDTRDFVNGLKDAGGQFDSFGGKVKDGLANLAKISAATVAAGATAVGAIVKNSVAAYGEYEQLVGGAQKIFDEIDYSKIAEDAANAYKDLNMSASSYLESINLAGATFAQTMGDEEGYNTARKGMLAIADFASGTGKNLSELNQKYQLITRSAAGYQSIADQFAGVLPQTSADFLEQAKAAGFLSDSYEELKDVPVAEYQKAVTAMLEKGVKDLGLSQNTVRESTETLTGSMAMTKAAWENLVTGLADPNADVGQLFDNMFDAAAASFDNILPTVEKALDGVGEFSKKAAPKISKAIKDTVPRILPDLLESGATLVGSLGVGLISSLPDLADTGLSIMEQINSSMKSVSFDSSGLLADVAADIRAKIPQVFTFGREILETVTNSIIDLDYGKLGESLSEIAISGLDNIGQLISNIDWEGVGEDIADFVSAIDWNGIVEAGIDAIGAAIKAAPDLIKGLLDNVDFMALSATAALKFTPKLISSLGDKLKDSDFGTVEKALGDKFHDAGNNSGLSFFGKFSAVVEAAMIGWNIGSVIYKAFEDEWDYAVGKIANKFRTAFGGDEIILEDPDLMNAWDEGLQKQASALEELPALDTFQPSSLPEIAGKIQAQQNAAAMLAAFNDANGIPNSSIGGIKSTISKLRNGFKIRGGGGMVRSPEISIVGEAGTEAVVPLKNDADGIRQIADQITRNMGATGNTINITVNASVANDYDVERLADVLTDSIDKRLQERHVASVRASGGAW